MDIVVKGRNVEVPDHYRVHVEEKLTRLERYDRKVIRFDVELFHEPNRRQSKNCQRVEITGKGRGPAVRAEASAGDFYAALDAAVTKLENRLRRLHDRRRVHYGRRSQTSVAEATAHLPPRRRRARAATNGRAPDRGAARARTEQSYRPSRGAGTALGQCRGGQPPRPDRPGEGARIDPDDRRPGPLPDGAGRPRLLPVPRRGLRPAERRLPQKGIRLRRDPAGLTTGTNATSPRVASSGAFACDAQFGPARIWRTLRAGDTDGRRSIRPSRAQSCARPASDVRVHRRCTRGLTGCGDDGGNAEGNAGTDSPARTTTPRRQAEAGRGAQEGRRRSSRARTPPGSTATLEVTNSLDEPMEYHGTINFLDASGARSPRACSTPARSRRARRRTEEIPGANVYEAVAGVHL